jgi:TPR repeat protein
MRFTDILRWLATGKVQTRVEKLFLAAQKGNDSAQFELGLCYHNGDGVPQDDKEAIKWFLFAARQGNAQAQFYLGCACVSGEGIQKDIESAYAWFAAAAAQGHQKAAERQSAVMKKMTPEQINEGQRLVLEKQKNPMETPMRRRFFLKN